MAPQDSNDPNKPVTPASPDPEIAAQMGRSAIGDEYLDEELTDPYDLDQEEPLPPQGSYEPPVDPAGNTPDVIAEQVEARRGDAQAALHEQSVDADLTDEERQQLQSKALQEIADQIASSTDEDGTFKSQE